jgi:processive 1,2-diacylglycerol beta-glucosyltransferase
LGLNKVLILSVAVGAGHMRTAEALKEAAGFLYPGAEIRILDTFRYASPFLGKVVLGAYLEMLRKSPLLYEFLYHQAEHGQPLAGKGKNGFSHIINILAAPRLVEYINNFKPEIIVCTHAFPLGIVAYLKKKGVFQGPVFAIITDYDVHSFYVFPEVDTYIVGSEELIAQCLEFGIEPGRVHATGIPIHSKFIVKHDKNLLREQIGLVPDLPVILLMGGGLGIGPLDTLLEILGSCSCQLICVAGANTVLQEKLEKMAQGMSGRVKIYGFVDNIDQLMAAADIMVGKAGGLACAEAMALGLPMFIVDPLPGQEERNTEFMTAAGAGVRVNASNLASAIQAYLEEPAKIEIMARAAAARGKPNAARDAVALMAAAVEDAEAMNSKLAKYAQTK